MEASPQAITAPSVGDLATLIPSFRRHLRASNLSPRTVRGYTDSVEILRRYLMRHGMPTTLTAITREHVESFIEDLLDRWKPSTANTRYRSLQAFFKWAVADGELGDADDPMRNLSLPKVREDPPPVLSDDALRALLRTCEGKDFRDLRDMALVRIMIASTGSVDVSCAGIDTSA
jgi:site-specific recombinase XerD